VSAISLSSPNSILWPIVKDRPSRSIEYIPEMRVDRPFLFLVFDDVTGLVLCSAVVNNVEKTKK
jgi:serine protease inhibitor